MVEQIMIDVQTGTKTVTYVSDHDIPVIEELPTQEPTLEERVKATEEAILALADKIIATPQI